VEEEGTGVARAAVGALTAGSGSSGGGGGDDGKSTVEEIRARFDQDVERFANLETGQSATIDAPLVLELIAQAAAATNPAAEDLLDVGCGAGNYTLKLLAILPKVKSATLIDLSRPMLDRAVQRINAAAPHVRVTPVQGDVRAIELGDGQFDVIVAAAVLHHLRADGEWLAVFQKFHRALRAGGSVWISDLVSHALPTVQAMMWRRYGEYLTSLRGERYRDEVFAYVEREDTPRSIGFQVETLKRVGFGAVDVLHKNSCFGALGAVK
jgi:tRNA (cmo5U34)-methyltransferase